MTAPHHSTLYVYCNDIPAMRHFYTNLIGLEESFFDAEHGWLTYNSGALQIVYMKAESSRPVSEAWAKNPGYRGSGSDEAPSWVLTVAPDQFDVILARLKADGAPLLGEPQEPQPGHRQIMTRDPMGTSLEVYAAAP